MQELNQVFTVAGLVVEAAGVLVILVGFVVALVLAVPRWRADGFLTAYKELRVGFGRSIIFGLEFLIAGDIIRTVTVTQTLESAAVLAVIVLIRVLLAFTLELEIGERGPWRWTTSGKSAGTSE